MYYGREVVFAMARDITERYNVLEALKESEANLKAILENTLESIWSVDINYVIQYVNEVFVNAYLNAFGVRLAPGVKIVDSVPAEMKQIWIERYERTFRNEHFIFEDRIDAGDTAFYVEVAMNPIVVDGKVVGADRAFIFEYDLNLNTTTLTFEWCNKGVEPVIDSRRKFKIDDYPEVYNIHSKGDIVKLDDITKMPGSRFRKLLEDENVISMITLPLILDDECTGFVGFTSMKQKHVFTELEQQILAVYAQTIINVKERVKNEQSLISAN